MKVLLLNGSPHEAGSTHAALSEVAKTLEAEGVSAELFWIGNGPVQDCVDCGACRKLHACVFKDDRVNEFLAKSKGADGFVFGTPVYFSHPTGSIQSFLDRAMYGCRDLFMHKPGAAVAVARRAGNVASMDVLNKYFTIAQMPVVSSTYWNVAFGEHAEDVAQDLEGLQTMRNLARNMAWLLKCIEAGRAQGVLAPERERGAVTNFIR